MDTLERIEAERACERLVALYALAVNDWDIDAFVSLFVPDAVWQRPKVPAMNGHADIRAFMEGQSRERTLRHVNGLCVVTVAEDGQSATSISQTTVYDTPVRGEFPVKLIEPDMVVEYRDIIVRRGGEWRFARRDPPVVFWAGA
ncbi:MAG: nuclear transport factor 2 family protein [Sphingomonadales bacterium]|nr:nuclear transport factor 2 family protein [Sphingomonadales bacterium]MBU3993091.1 nuclear transport factor 2 family protein [Alphaproteobacteria bacterium]